jgi:hypothetical protein
MGIFSRKKKEVESIEKTLIKKLVVIDEQVVSFAGDVSESKDQTVQVIHLTGAINKQDGEEKGQCFAVIGSPEGLMNMLEGAGAKEGHFARILITVAERLASNNPELARFQEGIKSGAECMCEGCQLERAAEGAPGTPMSALSIEDISNMTPEKMDELVKSIVKSAKQG